MSHRLADYFVVIGFDHESEYYSSKCFVEQVERKENYAQFIIN